MAHNALLVSVIRQNLDMMKMHFSDLSDADMLVRPVPNANHAAWQMAHLTNFSIMQAKVLAPEVTVPVPEKFADSSSKEAAKSDDPARFLTKDEVLGVLTSAIETQCTALEKMPEAELAKPGPEKMRDFAPTVGSLVMIGPQHLCMHMGQVQVIRRKLGKPVLF